ncbi:MAG TPA: SRPBCC domain-containing protein [Chryseolinea sp.]|nr:SRPBCC domain-containing protein [Chryseolinea sp.]HPH46294.1 SRPBCC domain-containing protein [Chryseolinea sp.]HPM30776.1 SRPBCC domain-containing protein [Chryseolinea sp.]
MNLFKIERAFKAPASREYYNGHEGNSLVTFGLFDEQSSTLLKLTHDGLETFPTNNPDSAKENFEGGWTEIIGTSLKEFLEKYKFRSIIYLTY